LHRIIQYIVSGTDIGSEDILKRFMKAFHEITPQSIVLSLSRSFANSRIVTLFLTTESVPRVFYKLASTKPAGFWKRELASRLVWAASVYNTYYKKMDMGKLNTV
jgi:hypothetical protein